MGKEIQMGKDLIITDEMREKFRLNEDPESEEPLRRPVQWRYLFPASVLKEAAGDAVQSRIRIARDWYELMAEYYPNTKEKSAAGISQKRRLSYNSPYYSQYSKDLADQVLSGESASLASLSQEELLELLS